MKWDKVTTDKSVNINFWHKNKIVYSVDYTCFCCDRVYGNFGWIRGFSRKDGITQASRFCG